MRTLPVALVLALAIPASAEPSIAPPPPPDRALVAAIAGLDPKAYPDAKQVVLVSSQDERYEKDGSFTNTIRYVAVPLTAAGKQDVASWSLPYAKGAETEQVVVARVIKKDGGVVPVPAADIQDTEQGGEENIYDPNGRTIKVTFSGLDIGDAVELVHRLTRTQPTRDDYFNDVFSLQAEAPMLSTTVAIDGPAAMPLTTVIYHPERTSKIVATRQVVGDRIHYTWRADRTPQLVPEANMNETAETPTLVVTTDPSWQHFSQWWAKLTAPKLVATPELRAKVAELTKAARTDTDKIKALYDFVSTDIRYRGLGVGPRTGYTPRAAEETYTSRWGVCRDVSILLTTMLRADGFDAYPVLTNVGDPVFHDIAYDGFNHAIVAMPKPGGGWTYLDPTAKNSHDLLPGYEAEQQTLVSTPRGEPLTQIPAASPAENAGHVTIATTVAADGAMTSKVRLETAGAFDMVVRGIAASMSEQQQRETVEQLIHRALPDAKLVAMTLSPVIALWSPMTVELEIAVPRAAVAVGDQRVLRTLVTSGALGVIDEAMSQLLGGERRRSYALDVGATFAYVEDETVALPAGTRIVALPNPARVDDAASALDASCTATATGLACHRGFEMRSRFVDPAQYLKLRTLLATLDRIARQPVILGGKS